MNKKGQLELILALIGLLIILAPILLLLGSVIFKKAATTGNFVITGFAAEDEKLFGYSKVTNCTEGVVVVEDKDVGVKVRVTMDNPTGILLQDTHPLKRQDKITFSASGGTFDGGSVPPDDIAYTWSIKLLPGFKKVEITTYEEPRSGLIGKYYGWDSEMTVNGNKLWEKLGFSESYIITVQDYILDKEVDEREGSDKWIDATKLFTIDTNTIGFKHSSKKPQDIDDVGVGVFNISICNFNTQEIMEPILDSYVSNYETYDTEFVSPCTKELIIRAQSYRDYECQIPLYSDCFGKFFLQYSTYKGEIKTELGEDRQEYRLSDNTETYCAREPRNTAFKSVSFNADADNPTISAVIQGRYNPGTVQYFIGATVLECANNDDSTKLCKMCEQDIENFPANTQMPVECRLMRKTGAVEYPYSFVENPGFIGGSARDINYESEDYPEDNTLKEESPYTFEFMNVSLEKQSLTITNDDTSYFAKYSFRISNKGDADKTVQYTVKGKKIDHLTDNTPEDFTLCEGSVQVEKSSSVLVNCNLENKDGQSYTTVSCDETDGCIYDLSLPTTTVEIRVAGQNAQIFKPFEKITDNSNKFVAPIYYDINLIEFLTPQK